MDTFHSTLTHERCRKMFHYDPALGNLRVGGPSGSDAGNPRKDGYRTVRVDRVEYLTHRLIWFWVHGEWPKHHIDHVDGCRSNNRIANLRDVPVYMNTQNLRSAKRNNKSSGLLGVYPNKSKWGSKITVNRTVYLLGTYPTPELAHEVYLGAKRLFHPGCTI